MATKKATPVDPVVQRLDAIESLLTDLLILQGRGLGLSKAQVREIVGASNDRVGRVWRHVNSPNSE